MPELVVPDLFSAKICPAVVVPRRPDLPCFAEATKTSSTVQRRRPPLRAEPPDQQVPCLAPFFPFSWLSCSSDCLSLSAHEQACHCRLEPARPDEPRRDPVPFMSLAVFLLRFGQGGRPQRQVPCSRSSRSARVDCVASHHLAKPTGPVGPSRCRFLAGPAPLRPARASSVTVDRVRVVCIPAAKIRWPTAPLSLRPIRPM